MCSKIKKLAIGVAALTIAGCGGGNGADSKKVSSPTKTASRQLSGVVMDGYLHNANVCVDKNNNAHCDSGDGNIARTDAQGRYQLAVEGNLQQYNILVEALSWVTTDMDNPNQTLTKSFVLQAPAAEPEVVTPLTSMVVSIAKTTGVSVAQAKKKVATDLNVPESMMKADYVANTDQQSKQIHMLARGIVRMMQSAQENSINSGVSEEHARLGTVQRLVNLDIAELKKRTDKLSHGAQNTEKALDQLSTDFSDKLKVERSDISGDKVMLKPSAPTKGVVNDAADTFDWEFLSTFKQPSDYEFSLDNGNTWNKVTVKPINIGSDAKPIGSVQVRVATKLNQQIMAGKALKSSKAYTKTLVPAAPYSITVNDALNSFDWPNVANFSNLSDYEFSVDGGRGWQSITDKPQPVADIAIASGDLQIRIRSDLSIGRPTGLIAKSTDAMTTTPSAPEAPRLVSIDDVTDLIKIELLPEFQALQDYEVNLGSGWKELKANPYSVGNKNINANTIRFRVKARASNARPAGKPLVISQRFTELVRPSAPTGPRVNDADNKFGWTNVTGFKQPSMYEYSVDGGRNFSTATNNPQDINDVLYSVGQVCVRVKATRSNISGSPLCNDKAYSITPDTPDAPTNGVIDKVNNTFSWDWVGSFTTASNYQYRIDSGDWKVVNNRPLQLMNRFYPRDSIEVRVKEDPITGRQAGSALSNSEKFTKQPIAPAGLNVDDNKNELDWNYVVGFESESHYEWSADSGSNWSRVTAKPIVVGDVAKQAGEVRLRVVADDSKGRIAGQVALSPAPFTAKPKSGWEYLKADGSTTSDRSKAQCVKNVANGNIWQIFQDDNSNSRYKILYDPYPRRPSPNIKEDLAAFNSAGNCGRNNWGLPTANELWAQSRPEHSLTFTKSVVRSPSTRTHKECYILQGTGLHFRPRVLCKNLSGGTVVDNPRYGGKYDRFLYRFISRQ